MDISGAPKNRLLDAQRIGGTLLFADASALHEVNEWKGAAISNRHLRPLNANGGILNSIGVESGEEVFDLLHTPQPYSESRVALRLANGSEKSGNLKALSLKAES
jgi:hypothetical protein